jgi:hypothetical protein
MSEETTEKQKEAAAFIIVKKHDGSFYATVDLSTQLELDGPPTRLDIKHGCQDILDAVHREEVASSIMNLLTAISTQEAPETPEA